VLAQAGYMSEPPDDAAPALLVRLWRDGAPLGAAEAARAVAPLTLDELAAAGLLAPDGDGRVRAAVSIRAYGSLLIAADPVPNVLDEGADRVPGVNPIARLLARHTVRDPVADALDLGTGNGIQALLAAGHAEAVLGTDVNPRALAYARLNAGLNGIANVRFEEGSWFEPAGEREFGLIVANPPFVISPEAALTYRDSGLEPGRLVAQLARGVAERLAPGGFGHVMCEWGVRDGEDWTAPAREWVAGTGCDALVLRRTLLTPREHAVLWNKRLQAVEPDRYDAAVERWTGHHREHGHARIAAGTIVLRRRADGRPPWFAALDHDADATADAGDHVRRIFAGHDRVRDHPERLLREPLAPVEGLRVEQTLTARRGRWGRFPAVLAIRPGLGVEERVDARVLDVVFALDGRRPVDEIVREPELRDLAVAELPRLVRAGLVA
jgi:methylase of polypeptide subunit release factors